MGKVMPLEMSMLSKQQIIEDAQRMGRLILDLEQRMHQIHVVATQGTPDTWRRFIPGYTNRLRLKHVAGLTAQFKDMDKIQVADSGPVRPVTRPDVESVNAVGNQGGARIVDSHGRPT